LKFDVVIIGGGAAGLFCAIEAGKRRRKVLVIERNAQVGRKIIISGGGRCNFTNLNTTPENFVSKNPHFCKSALARFTPEDFIRLVRKHKIEFYEKKLGQLFCRESSRQIVEMLEKECGSARVSVRTGASVRSIRKDYSFHLETSLGDIECESLVIAAGGLSFPKIGATDFGYSIARQFGLKIEPTRPSLVPLILRGSGTSSRLAGISVDSTVSSHGKSFRENILFTHRGLSGPAILQISNYWDSATEIGIDLLPDVNATAFLTDNRGGKQTVITTLARVLPKRLVEIYLPPAIGGKSMNQLGIKEIETLAARLNNWRVQFTGTEGYDKAEVTLGGVSTDELSSQTLECKKAPGLYMIGEVVDVTGWLGGYNFQWAWSSGFAAGQAV
jgi:predicted Rossmann fold flavoprotein